jgi:hypothetical protein
MLTTGAAMTAAVVTPALSCVRAEISCHSAESFVRRV